jgi:hypothetical protein
LTKEPKTYTGEKESLFNKYCWENWISACQRLKLDPCLSPSINIYSKHIKDLNVRPETSAGKSREHIGNNFLNRAPIAQQLSERIDEWYCMKLKSFSQQRKWSPD